jgi:very-long-chain (3R)-3-hydroxyacyl-CoA dehydratase
LTAFDWAPPSRYSAFILIYPVGVVAEMVLMYKALPFIRSRKLYSVFMPNAYNFAFDFAIFIVVGLGGRFVM